MDLNTYKSLNPSVDDLGIKCSFNGFNAKITPRYVLSTPRIPPLHSVLSRSLGVLSKAFKYGAKQCQKKPKNHIHYYMLHKTSTLGRSAATIQQSAWTNTRKNFSKRRPVNS